MTPLPRRYQLTPLLLLSSFFLVLLAHAAPVCFAEVSSERRPVVATITWRGQTDAERGFVEGLKESVHEPTILTFDANQSPEAVEGILDSIRNRHIDLIYVFGTTATQLVLSRIKDIPVVFNIVSRPIDSGIIADRQRSGNNATGVSLEIPVHHQLKALKKVVDFKVLGVIYNPREQNSVIHTRIVRDLEVPMGFQLKEFCIRKAADIPHVLGGLKGKADAVYIPADSLTISLGKEIMTLVNGFNIPSLSSAESMVPENGVLMALVPDYYQLGRMAAEKGARILAGGVPGEIPSSCPEYFRMWVNMPTARKINVQIPLSLLMMADKIVR
jgi:putative tryptophan/tyrosine transport system substrate-binding protein